MEGNFQAGWYEHPSIGLIKVYHQSNNWFYRCYTKSGSKALSREKPLDPWTWALSERRDDLPV